MLTGIVCLVIGGALITFTPRLSLALIQGQRDLYKPFMRGGDPSRWRDALGGLYPEWFVYEDGSRKELLLRLLAAILILLFAAGFITVGVVSL